MTFTANNCAIYYFSTPVIPGKTNSKIPKIRTGGQRTVYHQNNGRHVIKRYRRLDLSYLFALFTSLSLTCSCPYLHSAGLGTTNRKCLFNVFRLIIILQNALHHVFISHNTSFTLCVNDRDNIS